MANYRAPGVTIKEIDLSEVTVPVGTSVGAIVVPAYKGPVNRRVLIENNQDFVQTFGVPASGSPCEFPIYSSLETLKESDFLYVVRPTSTSGDSFGYLSFSETSGTSGSQTEAVAGSTDLPELSENENNGEMSVSALVETCKSTLETINTPGYEDGNKANKWLDMESTNPELINIAYVGPSEYSQNIAITIVAEDAVEATSGNSYGYNFTGKYPAQFKYYRINVYTKNENDTEVEAGWKTTSGDYIKLNDLKVSPDESWIVSNNPLAKDFNGISMYAPEVINGISELIYVKTNDNADVTKSRLTISPIPAGESSLGKEVSPGEYAEGWNLFGSKETSSPNILIAGCDPSQKPYINKAIEIANARKDCIAVVPIGDLNQTKTKMVLDELEGLVGHNSSYIAMYNGWHLIPDNYSGRKFYLPLACFMGAVYARNDAVANTWDAPAGLTRGLINSLGQANAWNENSIGILYNSNINTVKKVRGSGDYVWGQKTGQVKATALDRVNVRRLLLYIENTIEPMLQNYLFEPNTEKTRERVTSVLSSFLDTVYAGQGITKYQVVCDDTNNTPQTIDNNELNVNLWITPARTIEWINVNVIITNSGVEFTELM